MQELVEWINSDEASALHPIELAALTHWKLVYIHPFYDGNGRTARLVMNYLLMRGGYPPAIVRKDSRHVYYETLKTANSGDVRPFIRFIGEGFSDEDVFILTIFLLLYFHAILLSFHFIELLHFLCLFL